MSVSPCCWGEFGPVAGNFELDLQLDVPKRCRISIQKGVGAAGQTHEQAKFAVHYPAKDTQCPDEIALARAVRTDQDVHVMQGDHDSPDRRESLHDNRVQPLAPHAVRVAATRTVGVALGAQATPYLWRV